VKSSRFYNNPNVHYSKQDIPKPFNSRFIKRNFLNIPCTALSSSQKPDIYPRNEGNGVFPVIAIIKDGVFLGWDKGDMQKAPTLYGSIIDGVRLVYVIESNENNENILNH
jgi:hypothetical protein